MRIQVKAVRALQPLSRGTRHCRMCKRCIARIAVTLESAQPASYMVWEVQEAVAAALAEAAAAAGATSAVHAYWDATLYHPADLPSARQFRAASGAKPARAPRGSDARSGAAAAGSALDPACGGNEREKDGEVDFGRVAAVPGVMTNFIKVLAGVKILNPLILDRFCA